MGQKRQRTNVTSGYALRSASTRPMYLSHFSKCQINYCPLQIIH